MPFCGECGKKYKDSLKFCPHCGTPSELFNNSKQPDVSMEAQNVDDNKTQVRAKPQTYGVLNLENLPEGHIIDERYEIKEKLGQGGFGTVYRVYDKNMNIDKALKIIPEAIINDKEAMFDLQNEAQTMIALNHPNIIRVYDFHKTGSIKFIDMEFIDGKTLTEIKIEYKNKQVPEKIVQGLAVQIATGMSYAHQKGILHKDIKPQNVMVTKDNKVKLMDFGIAETVRTSMSRIQNSTSSGTLVYMSPEQLKSKDVGKESDIYSFGAMLYELLNGNPPFYKGDINYQILNEKPEPLDNVSDKMNDLIMKCLEKDYKDRFRNFGELKEYIEKKTEETRLLSKPETISQPKPKPISEPVETTENELKPSKQKSKSKKTLTWIIIIILLLTSILMILLNTLVWDIKMYEYDSNNSEAQDGLREVKQREDLKEKERIAELERLSKKELLEKANMVFVQGGTFQMGSNENDNEKPIHSVTVNDFYIGKYEVTQKEWKEIMGNNPSNWKGDNLPVEKVNWYDAVKFCNKKSDKEGLSRCYSGIRTNIKCNFNTNGYRLPTEAEWEYAARGGNKSKGYKYFGSSTLGDVAWYSSNSGRKTHSIGGKAANNIGIYDMGGNVLEWCNDGYSKFYYKHSPKNNPQGASSSSYRVMRGGSWYNSVYRCRVAFRYYNHPDGRYSKYGFRLARTP